MGHASHLSSDADLDVKGPVDVSQIANTRTLATGAASPFWALSESAFNDNHMTTLMSMVAAMDSQSPEYAFAGTSQNRLEDAMGVVVGAVLGQFWGQNDDLVPFTNQSALVLNSDQASVYAQRIGNGNPWAVLYVFLELFSIGIIAMLLVRDWRRSRPRSLRQVLKSYVSREGIFGSASGM